MPEGAYGRFANSPSRSKALEGHTTGRRRRSIGKDDFQAEGVMYLPEEARFSNLLSLPEGENVGMRVNDAMRAVA